MFSDRDPNSFTNLRENDIVVPGGHLDNSSSVIYDDDLFDDGQNTARIDLQQQHQHALETIRQLRQRLVRRTNTIEEIRRYYLRDIVTMKLVIREVLSESDRERVWQQYDDILPSLDLKDSMRVHAPHGYEFTIKPCEMCGGQLELVKKDTDQVEALRKALRDSKERENRWREKLAVLDAQVETVAKERAETTKSHMEEKRVLYEELKKVNEIIGRLKDDREKIIGSNKKLKEENETVKQRNNELEAFPARLKDAERDNEILKGNLQTMQEQLKISRAHEKALQKDLLEAQDRVKDLEGEIETVQQELVFAKQECKQAELAVSRVRDMSSDLEHSLEVVNREKLELNKRISELEEEALAMQESQSKTIREYERAIDQLRHDLREAQKTHKFSSKEQEKVVRELEICKETIAQLTELNKNQELELLDNAEEIQLFEQEIVAMQQFIREKVALRTFTIDADAPTAGQATELPDILKVIEGVLGDDDDEPEPEDIHPSEMELKREVSALSADDNDSVGSAGATKVLKNRHKALKSKRTVRQVNKAATEKKNQLLLKQASERLKPIDFSEISDDSGGEDNGDGGGKDASKPDANTDTTTGGDDDNEDGGAGSDEEATDKKKGTGKSPKKKKSGSTSSGGGGKKGNKSGTTRRSMQGSTPSNSSSSKKKSSDGHESADSTKPKKGSGKPSTPSEASKQASRAGSAGGSDVEDVRSSNGTPNRSALSSAEGKRPVSSTNRGAEAPKVHGRHHKKRMTSIKSSQVGELLEKAAQVAQEAVDLDEDPDKTDEHGDGSGKKPSEMTLGSDDEGEDEFITDGDDAAVHVTSSKKTGGSAKKTAPVKSRRQMPMNPTIPEESDAFSVEEGDMAPYGQVIVRSDMPVIEAAVAVAAASEVLSEIGIKPPSVASVLEDMLLTENQPKEVFHGVPNAKVEMKRSESVRRRKSIPKDFNFNVHSFEEHPPAPLEPLHLHIPPPKVLTIDTTTTETTSASSTDAPTADGGAAAVVAADGDGTVGPTVVDPSAQTTPSMLREARQMAETHARQHKQTRDLIDSTKDRLRQLRSLFDAPQNVLHPPARSSKKNKNHRTARSPGKESGDEEGDDADDDGEANAKSSNGAGLVIPRGPKIKGEEVTKKPAAKKDDDKKPPAPSYIIEEKKPKEKKAAAPVKAAPVKPVALAPPPPDATRLELSLRDQLLSVLHDATAAGSSTSSETVLYLNKNAIHCALNVMSPVLHQFSRMMEHAVHAMWDSLIVNRNSLDFYQKALVVFDGIVQCAAEDTTNVRVAEICAKLVPVAGATYNSHLTSAWQQACHIPASMVQDLTPFIVNYDTNERRSKTYEEFLHNAAAPSTQQQQQQPDAATDTATTVTGADDQSMVGGGDGTVASAAAAGDDHSVAVTATSAHLKTDDSSVVSMDTAVTTATVLSVLPLPVYEEKLVKALDTVQKMQEYGEQVKDRLNEDMVEVLREWSTSKTVHLELDERIELEKEKVRRAGEVKLAAVAKELAKVMAMNEKNQEKLREAEIKLKDIPMLTAENQRKQQALTEVKEKLETTETRLADRIKDFHDLQRVSTAQQNTIATLETNVQGLEQHISMVTTELTQEKAQKTTLDEYLRVRTAERDRLNEHLNTMVEQEHHRLHALHDVQIQYEPDNSDHQVQTEFLTAPLDIKTMLHHKQAQHAYAKFPMVYSAAIDTTTSKPGTAGMLMGSGSAGGGPRTGSSQFGGGGGGGGATMHQFSLHASPSTTAGGGGALSTARTNRTGNTYASSAGGGPLSSPHLGLERMNSTDSILQQFAGSDSFRVPPPIIHYDYDNRQHQEFIRQQQQAQEGGGSLLRQNQHSIGVGGDDGDMPGGGGSLYFDPRFNDSYDGDALNLQTPPYRPSSSAEDTNATENPDEEAFPAAPLGGNYTHHPQPMSTASSVASSKKVQHHHLVVPHSGRSGYHSDAGVNATSTGTTGDHHHHDRYRELAAQALMNRAHVHYEADGPASSSSQKNPLLGPLSLTKPSSASSGPGGGRTRANSYFDLSSPTSPRGGQHSPPNGPVPPAKKGAAMQHAAAASSSSPTYAAPQSHNGFQHHVPSKINTRTQEIRDGIVYQKRAGGGVGGGSNGGPGKSGIGLFKSMSTSTGGAVTPAQLQELTIDMTKAAQQQKNNSNSLPPLTMLGNGSMTLEGGPSMTSVKSHKSRAYLGPYKLDDTSHAPAIQMSKSTTSLGQAGLAALQSADTLKKLQKEFF